jgi:hypothetical protein
LERRITVTVPVAMIDDDGKRFKAEQELAPLRERFFNDLDKALQGDKTIGQKDVLAYLDVYARASESTFKPVKRDQTCPVNQSSTADGRLCAAASTAVNTAHYGGRDLAARVAITKKVIADRDAPLEIMKNGITQLFNVK